MGRSLREKILRKVWPLIAAYTFVSALGAFAFGLAISHERMTESLSKYIVEHGLRESALYQEVWALNAASATTREQFAQNLSDNRVNVLFDLFFPLREDGSRRSGDELYDGVFHKDLGDIHGFSTYLSRDAEITLDLKRELVSGVLAIHKQSPRVDEVIDNQYFIRLEPATIVVFGPYRDDRLMAYRYDIEPDTTIEDLLDESDVKAFRDGFQANAGTRCNPPNRAGWDASGKTMVIGCHHQSPISKIGAVEIVGITLFLNHHADSTVRESAFDGTESFILDLSSNLVFHSALSGLSSVQDSDVASLLARNDFAAISSKITKTGKKSGILTHGPWGVFGGLHAFYTLDGVNWRFIVEVNPTSIWMDAVPTVLFVFIATTTMGLFIVGLVFQVMQRIGVRPLTRLAYIVSQTSNSPDRDEIFSTELEELGARDDEIGQLTAALVQYRNNVFDYLKTINTQKNQLLSSLEKEVETNQLQNQFVSMVSHEFRTPLSIIDGHARRLARHSDNPNVEDIERRTGSIRESVSRLMAIMERMLDTSKLVAGKVTLNVKNFDLRETISKVVIAHRELNPDHVFRVDLSGVPREFHGDERLLETVFTNLISNAVKYSKTNPYITIRSRCGKNLFEIRIRDEGVGIPKDELSKVSERYFRAKTSIGIEGTGIGLNLVRMLVDQHGGVMKIDSVEGEWTEFSIRLPIRKGSTNSQAA